MELSQKEFKLFSLLEIIGRIDSYSAPSLESSLLDLMQNHLPNIVIDLKNVSYVSSSGLLVFVNALKKIDRKQNGKIVFIQVPELILSSFELSGFDSLFEFYDDLASAAGSFPKE